MARQSRFGLILLAILVVSFIGFFVIALRMEQSDGIGLRGPDRVGVLTIEGIITDAQGQIERLNRLRDDKNVRAIVLRIDSPGGAVAPSQELYREIYKANQVKPVITSVGTLCASGGYYAAMGTRRIFANPGSMVGSIGVIMEFVDVSELAEWAKVRSEVVKSGRFKDIGHPTRPMEDAERDLLQGVVDNVYLQFVDAVQQGRAAAGMTTDSVRAIADGRIFSGEQALDEGLVDEMGNLQDAIAYAGELVGLGSDPKVMHVEPRDRGLLQRLLEGRQGAVWEMLQEGTGPRMRYIWRPHG